MTLNESLLAQLRAEVSSDDSNNYRQITTKRFRSYGGNSSSSSSSGEKLCRLERQRQYTPGSEALNEWQLSQIHSQNLAIANEQAPEPLSEVSLEYGSGKEAGSELVIGPHMRGGLGKRASKSPIPGTELPATVEMQIESDEYGYDGSGHLCNPGSIPSGVAGDVELQSSEGSSPPCNSLSSDDEILRPQERFIGGIRGLSSEDSSDEGMGYEDQIQSTAGQGAHVGPHDEDSFDYRKKLSPLSTQQLRSFVFHDLTVTHHIPRIAIQGFSSLHISERPSDPRTTKRLMGVLTGLGEVRYDCCTEGCISYSLPRYSSLKECPIRSCARPRLKPDGTPFAQHSYIPITHRLRLMYSDKERAIEMMTYRAKMDEEMKTGVRSDFWSGDLFRDLRQQGLFSEKTDIALSLSSDGVKVFKTRSAFQIWPIMLMNLNLPPSIRSKRRNMLLVGFTPGPNNPKDLDSFLWPLVEEMLKLHEGIRMAWNAGLGEYFTLHAYITIVTADMPGREKLMHMKGNRAYRYCNYCKCRGVRSAAVYCPFSPPMDPPNTVNQDLWEWYDREELPMRMNHSFRADATHIEETAHKEATDMTGIAGLSILAQLPSIDFPRSFPPDSMHLFFENVVPALVRHYRGIFFKTDHAAQGAISNPDNGQVETEWPVPSGSRKRKRPPINSRSTGGKRGTDAGSVLEAASIQVIAKMKFKKTSDPWNVEPKVWERIGRDQKASVSLFPAAFGRAPRNFFKHCHEFSGEEWKQQATLFLPIYLNEELAGVHYNAFCNLVEIIGHSTQTVVTMGDIEFIRSGMTEFSEYYEAEFYQEKWSRLSACLPVMHQLLHVADGLTWLGPMHVYSQWGMERMCGMITRTAKSRVAANRNMELTLLLTEQKHILGYVLNNADWPVNEHYQSQTGNLSNSELDTTHSPCIEDGDGNLSLAKAFAHRLAVSRPDAVRISIGTLRQRFQFIGRVGTRVLRGVEGQRIREFMATRPNYEKDYMSIPMDICIWRWCTFRDKDDNKRVDFKVTSWCHKRANNVRNSSVVAYKDSQGQPAYAEIQFFFHARLPSELGSFQVDASWRESSDIDTEDEGTGTVIHHLAFIRRIPVEYRGRLVKIIGNAGAQAVIAVETIQSLIGRLKVGNDVYLTSRYTSMLGRM